MHRTLPETPDRDVDANTWHAYCSDATAQTGMVKVMMLESCVSPFGLQRLVCLRSCALISVLRYRSRRLRTRRRAKVSPWQAQAARRGRKFAAQQIIYHVTRLGRFLCPPQRSACFKLYGRWSDESIAYRFNDITPLTENAHFRCVYSQLEQDHRSPL
jgi:hypothetical protein